jgi:hypothetical protein
MSTRTRRGLCGSATSQRTRGRTACGYEDRELAALAVVDALLTESRVYLAARDGDRLAIDVVSAHGAERAVLAVADPDWGATATADGMLRLAAAMLAHALSRTSVDDELARAFADDVLRRVPDGGFAISTVDVRGWVIFHRAVQVPDAWR